MKLNKFCIALCLSLFLLFGCKSKQEEKTIAFLNYVKNEEYDKAKALMSRGVEQTFGTEGLDFRLKATHDLLVKYGIPSEGKWEIKYDTGREKEIFRMIEIIVPIYKSNQSTSSGDLEVGIELDYIYKMPFLGDSIFNFDTHIRRK